MPLNTYEKIRLKFWLVRRWFFTQTFKIQSWWYRPKILQYPHRILSRKAKPVTRFGRRLNSIVWKLDYACMNPPWGSAVGMAAPQLGYSLRVFVALGKTYVNPKITRSAHELPFWEGCFSREPDKTYQIQRSSSVWIKYQDIQGRWHNDKLNGFPAEVVQHEFDHLEGKCIL